MHAFTSNWVTVASSWPGVQTCVCRRSALFRWWAIISGAGVYLRVRVYNMLYNCKIRRRFAGDAASQ